MSATIVWFATIQHIVWGLLLIPTGVALNATALSAFREHSEHHVLIAVLLFTAAACAALGLTRPTLGWRSMLLMLPQQAILTVSAVTALLAITTGRYGDGVERPQAFIAADQLPVILLLVFYTVAVIDLHLPKGAWDA